MKVSKLLVTGAVALAAIPQVYYKIKRKNYQINVERLADKNNNYQVRNINNVSKKETQFVMVAPDVFETKCSIYAVDNPKAIVQLVHGSFEHRGRYREFIDYLNEQGYVVAMSDFRGHGLSTNDKYQAGYMDGVQEIVDDLAALTDYVKSLYPQKKVSLFGHSLGSMLVRAYLQKYDNKIDKIILSGTVMPNPFTNIGVFAANIVNFYFGEHGYNKLLQFLPNDNEWISYNEENRIRAKEDKLMPKNFQNAGYLTLFEAAAEITNYSAYQVKNPKLAILNLIGIDDQLVAGGHRGVAKSVSALRNIGYHNIKTIVYPEMKHEILNEDNKNEVYEDIVEFLEF